MLIANNSKFKSNALRNRILSIAATLMLSGIMNKFTMDGISMYSFKIWHIGVVIITAIVSILLFSIGDIKKASQINIVDGLREKYKL